jgi:hypothetical protein
MNDNLNDRVRTILIEEYNIEIGALDIFPGTNPDATPEDVAKEIIKAMESIAAGDCEEFDFSDEDKAEYKSFFLHGDMLPLQTEIGTV